MSLSMSAAAARLRAEREASLADLAELRGTTYGLLGSLFLYPARDDLDGLVAAAADLLECGGFADELPFFARLRALLDLLPSSGGEALERLEQEYVDLFVLGVSQPPCPPYESAYVERGGRAQGLVCVEVERAYAASRLALAGQGELPDHAALELGFLSLLCGEEEQAWREGEETQAVHCLRHQEEFHERHLRRWFPTFARRLERATAPGTLYRALADAAGAFVVHDRDLVHVLVRERSLAPAGLRAALP